jgi:hypothetical protein
VELASYGTAVPGLRLGGDSLEYYYTYASALAFLHNPPQADYCGRAEELFSQLMTAYGSDPTVAAIVTENRAICSDVELAPAATEVPAASSANS